MPVLCGSTTPCTATAAIAASIALPPERSTSRPAIVARGADVATMPFAATAAERPGTLKSRIVFPSPINTCRAILPGGLTACRLVLHGLTVRVNSWTRQENGWQPRISRSNAAGAGRSDRHRARRVLAAHAAALRAQSHQFVAARGRAGLDHCRLRLCARRDARRLAADFRRAARRPPGAPHHRHAFPPRPHGARLVARRALGRVAVDDGKGISARPDDGAGYWRGVRRFAPRLRAPRRPR